MSNLTKISKSSASLDEISKNAAIRPYLRLTEIGEIRLLEDDGKRLMEDSPIIDSTFISKNSETLTEISKNAGIPTKILKNLDISTILIDSYSESNQSAYFALYGGSTIYLGQSFTNTQSIILDSCKFYIRKSGNPTGNAYAKIYAHTGTYGTSSKPTGSALATSDVFDVSTSTTSYQLITFNFLGAERIILNENTYYCIEINFTGGDVNNKIQIGIDNSSPSHSGNFNYSFNGTTWFVLSYDICFYVYGKTSKKILKS